jgi:hypothetical protein
LFLFPGSFSLKKQAVRKMKTSRTDSILCKKAKSFMPKIKELMLISELAKFHRLFEWLWQQTNKCLN